MPQGAPAKKEKKKPKKDAVVKGVRATGSEYSAAAVEVVARKRKAREESV